MEWEQQQQAGRAALQPTTQDGVSLERRAPLETSPPSEPTCRTCSEPRPKRHLRSLSAAGWRRILRIGIHPASITAREATRAKEVVAKVVGAKEVKADSVVRDSEAPLAVH